MRYLDHENEELRATAAEGLAKLLLMNRIKSAQIFTRLMVAYFNPATEEDVRLRQCLSVFFPAFAFSGSMHQETIEEAFLPALRLFLHAPKSSPLHAVKIQSVAEYLVYLTTKDVGDVPECCPVRHGFPFSFHVASGWVDGHGGWTKMLTQGYLWPL